LELTRYYRKPLDKQISIRRSSSRFKKIRVTFPSEIEKMVPAGVVDNLNALAYSRGISYFILMNIENTHSRLSPLAPRLFPPARPFCRQKHGGIPFAAA
jgi:hypothetical protein